MCVWEGGGGGGLKSHVPVNGTLSYWQCLLSYMLVVLLFIYLHTSPEASSLLCK